MKPQESRKMSDAELVEETRNLRTRLFELRGQAVTEKLENPRQLRNLRRDIARLLTEQRSRAIAAAPQPETQPAAAG
ncbi:MAG: 50S ribosomal protein L29 [Planctomycetota bacterium]